MRNLIILIIVSLGLGSCTLMTRAIRYRDADIDDYNIFPYYQFKENEDKYLFAEKMNGNLDTIKLNFKYKDVIYNNKSLL